MPADSPSNSLLVSPPKFDYYDLKQLVREKIDGFRHYKIPGAGSAPSITTILSNTKTAEQKATLNAWKKRVGEEQAESIKNAAASLGTVLHENLECHLTGQSLPGGTNIVWVEGAKLAEILMENGVRGKLDEVWGCEVPLHYNELYAGTTDCVGVHRGQPAIIDFKTSRRPKKREWVQDYLAQGSAYGMAHNNMYGTDIRKTVIMMMTHDGEYQEFVAEGAEWDDHSMRWSLKVKEYHAARRNKQKNASGNPDTIDLDKIAEATA